MKNEYILLLFFLGTNFVPALCYAQEKQEIQIEERGLKAKRDTEL